MKEPITREGPWCTPDPLQIAAVMEPTVAMMSTSCIVKDEATGVTYMDTITTSMGRVALSGPEQGTPTKGLIIEDITDLTWWTSPWLPLGRRVGWWLPLGGKVKMPFGRNHYNELHNFNFSHTPWQLSLFIDWMGPCSPSPYHLKLVNMQYFIQFS